ncbi:MAG: hypothetical protein E6I73_07125 [Chloroflexi bacterium]|nr:MAG: hypothetical protein E6I73_07125 [Chloroflexota bacterium]
MGDGEGGGVGEETGVGVGFGVGDGLGDGVAEGVCDRSTNQTGTRTRVLNGLTRSAKVTSDRRPRDRPCRRRFREPPSGIEHASKPPLEHVDLVRVEQAAK